MRIVAGRLAGRTLVSPAGRVRPTAETLRVAAMDLVADQLPRATVLDLFAGTGALGLEALSRGATSVDFVENGASALHSLKANIAKMRMKEYSRLFRWDVVRFLEGVEPDAYRIAFADPPYGSALVDRVADRWWEVGFAGILVLEHASDRAAPRGGETHPFGDSSLTLFRKGGG